MATHTSSEYTCDNCGRGLPTCHNNVEIVTTKREDNPWSRLHVKIEHHSGFHNDSDTEDADLCKKCAVKLLTDALQRVKNGERVTEGVESSDQGNWER